MDVEDLCSRGAYREALALLPPGHPTRGEILFWLGDPQARAFLRQCPEPRARLAEARCCWQADLYEEGLKLLEAAPPQAETDLVRGLIWLCQGRGAAGEELVVQALPRLSGHRLLRAYYDLGVTYEFLGALPRALEFYQRAAQGWRAISPQHPELANALFGLAGVEQKLDTTNLPATVAEFLRVTHLQDPRVAVMAEAAVSVFIDFRQWTLVEDVLGELCRLSPRASYHYFLGQAGYSQEKFSAALEHFTQARDTYRGEGNLLHEARCLWMMGRSLYRLGGDWRPHFVGACEKARSDPKLLGEIRSDQAELESSGIFQE